MKTLAVPYSITIFKKCVKYQVDSALMKHLHFFDLQCLLIQFETQDILEYLNTEEQKRLRSKGIKEVRDIEGSEAIKFLGR